MARLEAGQGDAHVRQVFGEVLRQLRRERQLSQEALAEDAGLHVNHISFLERGLRSPNLLVILDLAGALRIPASDLIARVEETLAITRSTAGEQPAESEPCPTGRAGNRGNRTQPEALG